jgi:hypothetical protein
VHIVGDRVECREGLLDPVAIGVYGLVVESVKVTVFE